MREVLAGEGPGATKEHSHAFCDSGATPPFACQDFARRVAPLRRGGQSLPTQPFPIYEMGSSLTIRRRPRLIDQLQKARIFAQAIPFPAIFQIAERNAVAGAIDRAGSFQEPLNE